ncbi:MAG: cytidine deaminase [Firmicutes bacterium]|nr:cytidine deaminase [Bacillota bacterium]
MNNDQLLKSTAEIALKNAYSPYSKISVAAAILTTKGNIYTGVNIENSSYGLTVCAERNAIANAIINGEKEWVKMVILTDSKLVKSPCGACRQVIYEFDKNLPIDFYGPDGYQKSFTISKLLPEGFEL